MEITEQKPEDLQRKLYFLVDQLQNMARELPTKIQQRVPYELLSGLAHSLLNETVFEIVKGLMEIQQVSEKQLFQQRVQVLSLQKAEVQELMIVSGPTAIQQKQALQLKHKEELKQVDMKLVLQLDQKVSDQQVTLEKAGVPGFYVTNNPLEITVQMYLLDFIMKLSTLNIPP